VALSLKKPALLGKVAEVQLEVFLPEEAIRDPFVLEILDIKYTLRITETLVDWLGECCGPARTASRDYNADPLNGRGPVCHEQRASKLQRLSPFE
jgi:hypothetical protein